MTRAFGRPGADDGVLALLGIARARRELTGLTRRAPCLPDLPVAQNFALVLQEFRIRQATPEDAAVIGWHRARMFQDMGLVPDKLFESYRTKALDRLSQALASGDYVGWLASETNAPEKVIAGAGVVIRVVPPFPHRHENGEITIAEGRQGVIVNVFTEPEWRRRGIAKQLMKKIIAWSRKQSLDDLVLHASDDGRALYEQLGFVLTNEMRLGR